MILISTLMETAITITEATFLVLKKQVNLEQMAMCRKKSSYKSRASTGNPRQLRVMIPIKTVTNLTITRFLNTNFFQVFSLKHFDHQNKPSFIVDPCAGDPVKDLQKSLGAKLITTPLEGLSIGEFSQSGVAEAFRSVFHNRLALVN